MTKSALISRLRTRRLAQAVAAAVALTALSLPAASPAATVEVSIVGRAYQPAATTVNTGDTVTWTNLALEPHTVTSVAGVFDSGRLEGRASFSFTFLTPGSYLYACTIHPTMKGTVVVRSGLPLSPAPGSGELGAGASKVVAVRLSRHRGAHGSQTLVHVQAARPGAEALLELFKGSAWRRVAQTRLSTQGAATLSVSSSVRGRLRVVVLGQPGEQALISRVVRAPA